MTRRYNPLTRLDWQSRPFATFLRLPVRGYGYTLSSFLGRWCRHMPSCSEYMDEAFGRHGAWAGGWMGFARFCRCRPGGTDGLDPVPQDLPESATSFTPWRYASWRSVEPVFEIACEACDAPRPEGDHPSR